jgi:hypothetical protein
VNKFASHDYLVMTREAGLHQTNILHKNQQPKQIRWATIWTNFSDTVEPIRCTPSLHPRHHSLPCGVRSGSTKIGALHWHTLTGRERRQTFRTAEYWPAAWRGWVGNPDPTMFLSVRCSLVGCRSLLGSITARRRCQREVWDLGGRRRRGIVDHRELQG